MAWRGQDVGSRLGGGSVDEFLQALRRGVTSHVTEALAHVQGLGKEASWGDREESRWGSCRWALAAHLDYCGGEGVRGGTRG